MTPTPDAMGVTCYNPVVWGFKTTVNTYQYSFAVGVSIPSIAYAYFQGVTLKMTWYGGDDSVLEQGDYVTDSNGFIRRSYVIQGTEDITNPWHLVISEPSAAVPSNYQAGHVSYLDDSPVTITTAAPTPLPTPSCMNMPAMFADKTYSLEQYRFRYGNCTTMFYYLRWSTDSAQLAIYDGADNLIFRDVLDAAGSYRTHYHAQGTETMGTWHAVLYQTTTAPPSVFSGPGDFSTCIPPQIVLMLY
jgi:hypothetical protein